MTTPSSPILAGLRGRCGTCGEGRLFARYLTFAERCEHCGQDFSGADTADGPAFFVGFLTLIVFAPVYFIMPMAGLPWWGLVIGYALTVAACVGFCLALLPAAKGILFNLQLRHKAREAEFEKPGER